MADLGAKKLLFPHIGQRPWQIRQDTWAFESPQKLGTGDLRPNVI
jgi:hypothetical protein